MLFTLCNLVTFVGLKKCISISFLIIILIPLLSKGGFFIWFKMNQNEIANQLCINKNTEKADSCQGCCYLEKSLEKMNETSADTEKKEPTFKVNQEELIAIENHSLNLIPLSSSLFFYGNRALFVSNYKIGISDPPPRF